MLQTCNEGRIRELSCNLRVFFADRCRYIVICNIQAFASQFNDFIKNNFIIFREFFF